jgi:hypothetical protein
MQKTTPSASLRLLIISGLAAGALAAFPGAARAQDLAPPTAATGAPAPAAASADAPFGAAGQWVISVPSLNAGTSLSFSKQASGGSRVLIQPAIDYFVTSGLSVGGLFSFGHAGGATTIGLGARAGFNQALTERVSFWPTAGIIGSFISSNGTSSSTAELVVLAPFLYHPAPHFFLGAGPFLSYLFKGGPDTQYGIDFVIGGWL